MDEPTPLISLSGSSTLLAKVRATDRMRSLAADSGVEELETPATSEARGAFAFDGAPRWFSVEVDPEATPWDEAHAHVADRLGVDGSHVLFVEPDFEQSMAPDAHLSPPPDGAMAADAKCEARPQDGDNGKVEGPDLAWHLDDSFSQLWKARSKVDFDDGAPTLIAHLDTGYQPDHETVPAGIRTELARNFVDADNRLLPGQDPGRGWLKDNSGHGTGTISILAGSEFEFEPGRRVTLGGAPDAGIVPLRVAKRVVLVRNSAIAEAITHAASVGCAVASMSMGGVPSQAWADAIDAAYLEGLCLVAAAGNRFFEGPPRAIVYPARYDRVVAVTGAMADGEPYENLDGFTMEGVFGPRRAMDTAMAAYTPNIPWAVFGCSDTVRFDGEGTSAATPQVAAAAALWIEKSKAQGLTGWQRVEAVRQALFSTAVGRKTSRLGHGILRADRALRFAPTLNPTISDPCSHSLGVFRMLSGLFIDGSSSTQDMFELELAQLLLRNLELAKLIDDPDSDRPLTAAKFRDVLDVILADENASLALKEHLEARYSTLVPGATAPRRGTPSRSEPEFLFEVPRTVPPARRRVRVFAKDPTLASAFATASVAVASIDVPWEPLESTPTGFRGEHVEIVEEGYAVRTNAPTLDHPSALAQDGWDPAMGNPLFHEQMTYAVSMKTIEHFERALGRPVLWRHTRDPGNSSSDRIYTPRLRIRPHAMQTANAYYSPSEPQLRFGYFMQAGAEKDPAARVYTCLSQDIIAHETCHAVLDGMHRYFTDPTNPDVLAFHEGFSDLVALLQGFDLTELLLYEINASRGYLTADTILGKLAVQFGTAARGREALRSAIGHTDSDGDWVRSAPDPTALADLVTPHERGAVLVSAVFDALIAIYRSRTADLFRIAAGRAGRDSIVDLDPDLARRLANEASKSARHLLRMCIRALDYMPPVDVTFFDFLRAIITADQEYVPDDRYNYRLAVAEAFAARGIGPGPHDSSDGATLQSLAPASLAWRPFDEATDAHRAKRHYTDIVTTLRKYAEDCVPLSSREESYKLSRSYRFALHCMFDEQFATARDFRNSLGLTSGSVEVHSLRRAMRARPNGRVEPEVIVTLVQNRSGMIGGATLIINLAEGELPRYKITKAFDDADRMAGVRAFAAANDADQLRRTFLAPKEEHFAALHDLSSSGSRR